MDGVNKINKNKERINIMKGIIRFIAGVRRDIESNLYS